MGKNLITLLFAFTLIVSASWELDFDDDYASASQTKPDVLDGLVAWWKMDEALWNGTAGEVKDATVNAYNGTSYGGSYTTNGVVGRCGYFNGSDGYVSAPNVNLGQTNNSTFCFWANPKNINQLAMPFGYRQATPPYSQLTIRFSDGTGLAAGAGKKFDAVWYPGYYGKSTDANVVDGNWHFFAVVFKYGDSITLYVDGVAPAQSPAGATSWAPLSGTIPITIGSGNTLWFYNGSVDEARVYNRALTADEILTIYNKFK